MYVEKQHSQKTSLFPASAGLTNMPKPKDNFANATEAQLPLNSDRGTCTHTGDESPCSEEQQTVATRMATLENDNDAPQPE